MIITMRVIIPGITSTPIVKRLVDLLNEVRATKNIYPRIGDFCKYLSIQNAAAAPIQIAASPNATGDEVGFVVGDTPFVLEDRERGLIPLGEIYVVVSSTSGAAMRILLIQD